MRLHSAQLSPTLAGSRRLGSLLRLLLLCAGALASLGPEPLRAGSTLTPPADTNLLSLSFEQLLEINVDKVYGASRYEQSVSRAPSSVSIVTADEISKFGYRTLSDVLRSLRGIYATDDRNYTYLGFRGFSRPGDYNSRVLLRVDGHRMNDNVYETAMIGYDEVVDLSLIERVEVVRGPSSSIYGNNAFFGVVNVITKPGASLNGVRATLEAGGYETYAGRFSYGRRFTNGVELVLAGAYYESAGERRLYYPEFDDPATNFGVAENSDGEKTHKFFAKVRYRDFTLTGAYSSRTKHVPTASYESLFNDGGEFTKDAFGYVDLRYDRALNADLEVLGRVYFDHYAYAGDYPYDYADPGDPLLRVINRDETVGQRVGAEAQADWTILDRHRLIAGVEYNEDVRRYQANFDIEPRVSYLDDDRSDRSIGAYSQGELNLLENLVLNGGVRGDYYDTFGGTINPRLAVIHRPWERTTLKLLYGQAFRAPNAYELYYAAGGLHLPNPDLDPETIRTYELVLEQGLTPQWRLSLAGYYYQIDNLISLATASGGLLTYRNVDEVEAKGVEAELEGRYPGGVLIRASYALQRAEDARTGEELTSSPRHLAALNYLMPVYENKLYGGLELQYFGTVTALSGRPVDDFVLANLTLLSRNVFPGLEVSASLYNLGGADYGYSGSVEHVQAVIPQPGRQFRVRLTFRF